VNEGLSIAEALNDRFYEVELHRLKGELMLHSGANRCNNVDVEAEESYRKALQVGRDQSAKSWELRAAMSLVRLLQKQNRREEARAVLTPTYEWFTEGLGYEGPERSAGSASRVGPVSSCPLRAAESRCSPMEGDRRLRGFG
jgi:predicted ATPase